MCTAISLNMKDHYFGRNLDLEYSYNESVTITPRNFEFNFRYENTIKQHYAIIGMSYVKDNYPLYYDATNEKGLSIAGLNFPHNAKYFDITFNKINLATFEFMPYILSYCTTVEEAASMCQNINLTNACFSDELPVTPLHWMISDKDSSITVESVSGGLKIYQNPVGVLTNNPPFDMQLFNLNNYMHLSEKEPKNTFIPLLERYSRGMGAIGLPGDWSSQSRFVRAVFVKEKSISSGDELNYVNQFFHLLSTVAMPRGCVKVNGYDEITVYSSCVNTKKGIYYYKTYNNSSINAIDINKENLTKKELISYPLLKDTKIFYQN